MAVVPAARYISRSSVEGGVWWEVNGRFSFALLVGIAIWSAGYTLLAILLKWALVRRQCEGGKLPRNSFAFWR